MTETEELKILMDFRDNPEWMEPLKGKISDVNVFDILNLTRYEIRHSNMLAWLLNPNESHGWGDEILRGIVEKHTDLKNISDYHSFVIRREWKHTDLVAVSARDRVVICIENKIDAEETGDQLNQYLDAIRSNFPGWKQVFLFLTPGREKSSNPDVWKEIGYKDILEIIRDAKNMKDISPEAEILINSYEETVRRDILMDNEDIEQICNEIYSKHRRALDLIFRYKTPRGGSVDELSEREGFIVYQIQQGDTLNKIAKEYHTTPERIIEANSDTVQDMNCITIGYYIYIPE